MKIEKDCLYEIYTKSEDSFSVGEIYYQDADSAIFYNIDEQGKLAGYYAIKKKSITNILFDTEYLWKMEQYIQYGLKNSYESWFSLKEITFDVEQPLFLQVLQYAKKRRYGKKSFS